MGRAEASQALVAWIRSRGGFVHEQLDLFHELANGDRGVVALEDIAEGEQLCLIPVTCTLHVPTAAEIAETSDVQAAFSPAALHLAKAMAGETSPFIATVLLLMAEVARGDKSPWQAYIQSLPESCDCLLSWSDEDKQLLKGTSIEDLTGGQATESAFNKEVAPQVKAHPDLWPERVQSFAEFCRVAGLVQSRAFHMVAENWVTGTQQEGNDIFLIPGIDMINHSSDPDRRNASLLKLSNSISTEVDGKQIEFTGFFTMKAEKPIKKGGQVLHTYGDLSDSQLLQTYGFVDLDSEPLPAAEEVDDAGQQGTKKRKAGAGAGAGASKVSAHPGLGSAASKAEAAEQRGEWINPYNHALVPMSALMKASRGVLREAKGDELEQFKLDFLVHAQLLQPAAPTDTQFVITAAKPLPDELLTVTQVLLMTDEEFEQLAIVYNEPASSEEDEDPSGSDKGAPAGGDEAAAAPQLVRKGVARPREKRMVRKGVGAPGQTMAGVADNAAKLTDAKTSSPASNKGGAAGAGSSSGAADAGGGKRKPPLVLREELLGEDIEFAELVSLTIVQVVEWCLKRFPATLSEDRQEYSRLRQQLASSDGGSEEEAQGKQKKKRKGATASPTTVSKVTDPGQTQALLRRLLALKVRIGEQHVLNRLKAEAISMVLRLEAMASAQGSDEDEDEDEFDDSDEDEEEEEEEDQTDDSDKVGYAEEDLDDGIGEAHDNYNPRPAPKKGKD